MLRRIWQQLVSLFQGFLGLFQNSAPPAEPEPKPDIQPLSDAESEHFFLQLLDGVHKGWQQVQVRRFFEALSHRASDRQWIEWLRRFGDNLLASPVPNHELGRRLVRLGEVGSGEISEVARNIGTELLAREAPATHEVQEFPTEQTLLTSGQSHASEPEGQEKLATFTQADFWAVESAESPGVENSRLLSLEEFREHEHTVLSQDSFTRDRAEDVTLTDAATPIEEPQDAQEWFNRGIEQLEAGNDRGAIAAFDRVVELDPNHHRAWINRGDALTNLGSFEEGVMSYDRALAIQPDASVAWSHRGDVLYDSGQIEAAIASWDKALEFKSDDAETWYNRGVALGINLGRWEEALMSWNRAIAIQPHDAQTWFHHGVALASLNRLEEALESWDKATDIKIDFRDAWINKGVVLQRLGRYSEAIAANDRAIGLFSPDSISQSNPNTAQ